MSYDEVFCEEAYDTAESDGERAADHQKTLDVLYLVGNQYSVSDKHMRQLCELASINFSDLQKYSGGKS